VLHATEGELRRLDDEPLAVPDRTTDHVAACRRCAERRAQLIHTSERCAQLLSGPQLVPNVDEAWARLQRAVREPAEHGADEARLAVSVLRRAPRFMRVPVRTAIVIGAASIVVAGTTAAATLTTVFDPTHVAPLSLSQSDLQAVAGLMGLGDGQVLGGFNNPSGSHSFSFGTVAWSSSGPAQPVTSLAEATAESGFPVKLPSELPSGVGRPRGFVVQPRVSATVTFNSTASGVAGSTVDLNAGPAVLVEYGSSGVAEVPTLAMLTMPRPTAVSSGATMSQIEAFLLRQPGIPAGLAEEIRLLGDLGTTLPVPVPSGASVHSVQVAGSPGVLVSDASNAVAGVIWEDGSGTVHLVAGLLDPQSVLNVADQVG
jgi:hypothetical protein